MLMFVPRYCDNELHWIHNSLFANNFQLFNHFVIVWPSSSFGLSSAARLFPLPLQTAYVSIANNTYLCYSGLLFQLCSVLNEHTRAHRTKRFCHYFVLLFACKFVCRYFSNAFIPCPPFLLTHRPSIYLLLRDCSVCNWSQIARIPESEFLILQIVE